MSSEKKEVIILCGGGGSEHEVSLRSADYIYNCLATFDKYRIYLVEIKKDGKRINLKTSEEVELRKSGEMYLPNKDISIQLDFAIPCIHGYPGETGDIQSLFEMMGLPYLGCNPESSVICFNKISTKLWLEACGIKTTPYTFINKNDPQNKKKLVDFFHKNGTIYLKASKQGSSVGCYQIKNETQLEAAYLDVFNYSDSAVVEKEIVGRELEVSTFEYQNEIMASSPGEILCPSDFYSYDEKYSEAAQTTTNIVAENISKEQDQIIKDIAIQAYRCLNLRHLSRIDFFLSDGGEIYINEINTFPGMTSISLFPKMMENMGIQFADYLNAIIDKELTL